MNTRKLFSILAVTVAILLICTACGGSPTDSVMVGGISVNGGLGGVGGGDYDGGGGGGGNKSTTPKGLKVEEVSEDSITISWNEVDDAIYYTVYRSEKSSGPYEDIKTIYYYSTDLPSYKDTRLDSKTTYYYKISAFTLKGEGAQSSYISAKTK